MILFFTYGWVVVVVVAAATEHDGDFEISKAVAFDVSE